MTLFLCTVAPSSATNLFQWNADQLSWTSLGPILTVLPNVTIDTSVKHQGTGSVRYIVPGAVQANMIIEPGDSPAFSMTSGGWRYYRWWMKFDPAYRWGSANQKIKAGRLKRQGDVAPSFWTMYMDNSVGGFYIGECSGCSPGGDDPSLARVSYNLNPMTNPAITNWQEYIMAVKLNTSTSSFDGQFKIYVNGVQVGNTITGMQWSSDYSQNGVEAWGAVMVENFPQLNDATAGGTIWLDDFSLDDTFNSNFNSQPNPNAPSAPSNLKVN